MKKVSILVLISVLFCLLSCLLCYFIAEKFFFDKFFYQKSLKYGYIYFLNKNQFLEDFSKRGKDLISLNQGKTNILGATDDGQFKIGIFGDSFVWGTGVTNNQRFSHLLEKSLNKIRPTKIYSFGNPSDNIFDNYIKYQQSLNVFGAMDLYIFAFYNNDLIFNSDDRYGTNQFLSELNKNYTGTSIYNQPNNDINDRLNSFDPNSVNFYDYQQISPLFPKENSIYIDLGNTIEQWEVQTKFSKIINQDFNLLNNPFLSICDKDKDKCYASNRDKHPSSFTHKYYSNLLFKEITTNSKWNFSK